MKTPLNIVNLTCKHLLLSVKIKAQTWERDSNGLYDYDSTRIILSNINFIKSGYIKRSKDNKVAIYQNSKGGEGLLSIAFIKDKYYLDNIYPLKLDKVHKSQHYS